MKRSGPTHFKTERLMQALDLARYEAVGILELLWHFADAHAPDGNLSRFRPSDIAAAIGTVIAPDELVDALVSAGYLDRPGCCEKHTLILHDRADHAQESVKKTVLTRQKSSFVEPCPDNGRHSPPEVDAGGVNPGLSRNAAMPNAEAESPGPPSTESEQSPSAPRQAPDIFDEGRRTGESSDSVDEKNGGCSDSGFGQARAPPPPTESAPDPREVDQLALHLADVLRIKHPDELRAKSVRWRQAKTDRTELAAKISPAILAEGNGLVEWAIEQAKQSSTADRPMAVFKKRLQKQGVIESVRKEPRT